MSLRSVYINFLATAKNALQLREKEIEKVVQNSLKGTI